jgi:hypothetical protein
MVMNDGDETVLGMAMAFARLPSEGLGFDADPVMRDRVTGVAACARHCRDLIQHAPSLRVGSTCVPERTKLTRQSHREIPLAILDRQTEGSVQTVVLEFELCAHGCCPRPDGLGLKTPVRPKCFGHCHKVDSLTVSDFGSFATASSCVWAN